MPEVRHLGEGYRIDNQLKGYLYLKKGVFIVDKSHSLMQRGMVGTKTVIRGTATMGSGPKVYLMEKVLRHTLMETPIKVK